MSIELCKHFEWETLKIFNSYQKKRNKEGIYFYFEIQREWKWKILSIYFLSKIIVTYGECFDTRCHYLKGSKFVNTKSQNYIKLVVF